MPAVGLPAADGVGSDRARTERTTEDGAHPWLHVRDTGRRTDNGLILPGRSAWFTIGTGTGYGSPLVVFDPVVIDVGSTAGGKASQVNVALSMDASSPPGKAIPVTVTALAPGVPPKP